jgi:hypothetical protein
MAPRAGTCGKCGRATGALTVHERHCNPEVFDASRIARAGAHAAPESTLRAAQRFQDGVTELDVARVMHELERGLRLYLNRGGRWCAPRGSRVNGGGGPSAIVKEMIRTGLVRHYKDREGDHLIPAKVHLDLGDRQSACHFIGEDLGPMRARLLADLALVDCLACADTVANGHR